MTGQTPLTDEQLARLQKLSDEATRGPWYVDRGGDFNDPFWQIGAVLRDRYGDNSITSKDQATIELIAAARNALPALLAEVREARRSERERREAFTEWLHSPKPFSEQVAMLLAEPDFDQVGRINNDDVRAILAELRAAKAAAVSPVPDGSTE